VPSFKALSQAGNSFILYDCKTKNGGSSRNTEFFTIEGNKIKEVEVYFGSVPKGTVRPNPASFRHLL
jgi:hypothetical protein